MKKVLSLLPLAFAIPAILAAPAENAQVVLGGAGHAQSGLLPLPDAVEGIINKGEERVHQWYEDGKQFIKQHGLTCKSVPPIQFPLPLKPNPTPDELVQHPHFGDYKLRVTSPKLCDPSVKQYSGYLDITDDKHLFFWSVDAIFFFLVSLWNSNLLVCVGF